MDYKTYYRPANCFLFGLSIYAACCFGYSFSKEIDPKKMRVSIADVNSDGKIDVVIKYPGGHRYIFLGNGSEYTFWDYKKDFLMEANKLTERRFSDIEHIVDLLEERK